MNRLAELNNESTAAVTVRNDSMYSDSGAAASAVAGGGGGADGAAKPAAATEDDNPLEAFYTQVNELQGIIRDIQQLTTELKQKHAEKMLIVDEAKASAAAEEIAQFTEGVNKCIQGGKQRLDAIAKGTAALKKTPEMEANNAGVIKIQQNQHAHLVKLYTTAVQEYQTTQKENEKAYLEQTKRRIMTKMRDADGSTISEERAAELAQEAIDQGTENAIFQQAKDTLAQIIETRNDIYRIEQSMRELNQLFQDLAVLVNEQQEAMDNILVNVQNSVKYVQKGREELAKAKVYAKKSRKKMCWILVIVFVVFLFILAIVLGVVV
mmetsp:Transcript_74826/g.86875  ORF Transcript_74826/g.86875 Transcript_74826/m.86875 type:complete len:323 (-) Transcript_74826:60-1028(-)